MTRGFNVIMIPMYRDDEVSVSPLALRQAQDGAQNDMKRMRSPPTVHVPLTFTCIDSLDFPKKRQSPISFGTR